MIVMKTSDDPAFGGKQYSHIECDVEGCGVMSPPTRELMKGPNLMELGWFIDGGRHRCPEHVHDDVPAAGPVTRNADGSEGNVR